MATAVPPTQRELAETLGDVHGRLAALSPFGRNDHDAGGRLGSVERSRRRAFQHLERFDVVGIDVRDAVHHLVLRAVDAAARVGDRVEADRDLGVAHQDAIDHVERLGIGVDRSRASDLDLRSAARCARVRRDESAGDLALERVFEHRRRRLHDLLRRKLRHRLRRVRARYGRCRARDDHSLELENIFLDLDLDFVLPRGERDAYTLVPNVSRNEHLRAFTGVGDYETAVIAGVGCERGALHRHGGSGYGLARVRDDAAGDSTLRRCAGRREREECARNCENVELPHKCLPKG
jgi:hypothetical protein